MALPEHFIATFAGVPRQLHEVRMICPHCENASTFAIQARDGWMTEDRVVWYGAILKCNFSQCYQRVYIETTNKRSIDTQDRMLDEVVYFPSGKIAPRHEAVPVPVGEDWTEAQKAFRAGAVKATAVMCRRVLYGILLDQGVLIDEKGKEKQLKKASEDLLSKIRVPSIVEQWLIEIREDGHDGAHPSRALYVPEENVVETMGYTEQLLHFIYVLPFELKSRLARKAAPTSAAS